MIEHPKNWREALAIHTDAETPPRTRNSLSDMARAVLPIEPSAEVLLWVRSRNIAWAKAKGRAA